MTSQLGRVRDSVWNQTESNSPRHMVIGEESGYLLPPGQGRAAWANDHFIDGFFTFTAWVVPVLLLGFLGRLVDHDDVGPGAVGVFLGAPLQHQALARRTRRHDALTHLTAEHGNEPID